MHEMILHVSGVVAPVLLCVLAGYGLAIFKLPFENKVVGALVANIGYPTLILSHLTKHNISAGGFLEMMLAALAAIACFGAIGMAVLACLRLPVRTFLSSMMLNNVGNIGLPVCALAFGDRGLAYAMAFVVVVLVGVFTIGMWLPMGKITLREIVRQPVIYAVAVAIPLMVAGIRLPTPIDHAFTILGGLAIPLMLLTLGHTLATLKFNVVWRGCVLALLHLVMGVGVAFVLIRMFSFEGPARGVLILECVMPASVATYLWVEMYDPKHAPDVASFILFSTFMAIVVLPLVLTFWI